ncbi:hypothetical protein [Halorubellus sp. PRR65]|uniref:hypothetical protein n=1 Tax=Halorubellus sp. PRR65 TaxID=3098148 RepID=UPI002B26113E|nr:hypothetical protein [Halorubellus sp. PRR65]
MNARIDPSALLRESVPLAVVVGVWTVLSLLGGAAAGPALRFAGIAMALGYAFVRSRALAARTEGASLSLTPAALVRANATPVLAAAPWFLAARLLPVFGRAWGRLGLPGAFVTPAGALRFFAAAVGFLTVVLYVAVFARTHTTADRETGGRPTGTEAATGGD